jgi:hypothetical protein
MKLRQNGWEYPYTMSIKMALKLNSTFISSVRNDSCHLKLSILKNCSRRIKHKAENWSTLWEFSKKKINYLFPIVQELYIF